MNTIQQIGRLTKDPVLEYAGNIPICKFTIALDSTKKDKQAEFIRWTVFDKQAENLCKYMSQGRQIAVIGHQVSGSYKSKEGKTIYTQDNIADRIEYLGSAEEKKPDLQPAAPQYEGFQQAYDDIPFN